MNPAELVDLAIRLWPLFEKILALNQDRASQGLPPATLEEARAELNKAADELSAKIQADIDSHPV